MGAGLWRIGRGLWTTRRGREIARKSLAAPLASVTATGIELLYRPAACGGKGAGKQEDPDRELARGAGRWWLAGSDGFSGRSGATARSPRGSWCSYHREPLTYFPRSRGA